MAKLDIRGLNYITSSGKQNTFNIDIAYTDDGHIKAARSVVPKGFELQATRTFFGNVGEEESMSQRYGTNMESLYDVNNNIIIHNLYDLTKVKLKASTSQGSSKKVDLFIPEISDDFLDVCQFDGFAYGLTKRTNDSLTVLSTCMNNKSDTDYSYHYQYAKDGLIATHLYPIVQIDLTADMIEHGIKESKVSQISTYDLYVLGGGVDPMLSAQRVANVFNVARNIQNVKYNYLVEIPENMEFNKYEDGYIQCNAFLAKNDLTYQYDMNVSGDLNGHVLNKIGLYDTRDYIGLGVCGGKMYMKYRDNISYPMSADEHVRSKGNVIQHKFNNEISADFSFQHVEIVNSLNRFSSSSNGHKSSMYSLSLNDTGLNSSNIAETTKAKLRQNITNSIRVIAEKICPANTQLFQVYFEGK